MFLLGSNTNVSDTGVRLRALREALGLTQKQVAERSGEEGWDHTYVGRCEKGGNKLTSAVRRRGLARGLGVELADFEAYVVDERITLEQVVAKAKGQTRTVPTSRHLAAAPATAPEEFDGDTTNSTASLEDALDAAFDGARHRVSDATAVRRALGDTFRFESAGDLVGAARAWLDAASRLRRDGREVTTTALLEHVTLGALSRPLPEASEEPESELMTLDGEAIAKTRDEALKRAGKKA